VSEHFGTSTDLSKRHFGPKYQTWQPCVSRGEIVQLPCASDPPRIRHLLTVDLAQTLACSLILFRIDYWNDVLHGAASGTIQKLQRVQNNAARVVLRAPRRSHANSLLQKLHWLPVEQRITYKLAVLTYKTRQTYVPEYLSRHITTRSSTRSLRSSSAPLLHVPFRRTSPDRASANAFLALQHHLSGTLSPFRTVTRLYII